MGGIKDIEYVRFAVPDIDKQQKFLEDFGFLVSRNGDQLFARGTDPNEFLYAAQPGEAKFLGMGYQAESLEDLQRIAAIDGVPVTQRDAESGGQMATLEDPDGYRVDIVYGMSAPESLPVPSRSSFNTGEARTRLGSRAEFNRQPYTIKRLGHCVLGVADLKTSLGWYMERLGLLVSDEVFVGDESNTIGAFMRCNRGDQFVDHHTLFLLGGPAAEFNHAAFEIADWDTLMEGHYELQRAGYKHSWGVGKHLLGSQVFDYWRDPHGFLLEHFTDGDLLNEAFGSHKAPIDKLLASFWGPEGGPT